MVATPPGALSLSRRRRSSEPSPIDSGIRFPSGHHAVVHLSDFLPRRFLRPPLHGRPGFPRVIQLCTYLTRSRCLLAPFVLASYRGFFLLFMPLFIGFVVSERDALAFIDPYSLQNRRGQLLAPFEVIFDSSHGKRIDSTWNIYIFPSISFNVRWCSLLFRFDFS